MTPGATRSVGRRLRGLDRTAVVELLTERVDDATDQLVADRHLGDATGGANVVAFLEVLVRAEDDRADTVLAKVEREREDHALAARPGHLEQLAGHRTFEAVDARDAVADRCDDALVGIHHGRLEARDPLFENLSDLVAAYCHQSVIPLSHQASAAWSCCRWVRRLSSMTRSPMRITSPPTIDGSLRTVV